MTGSHFSSKMAGVKNVEGERLGYGSSNGRFASSSHEVHFLFPRGLGFLYLIRCIKMGINPSITVGISHSA